MTEQKQELEYEKIKARPYSYICDYVESVYPMIGRKTFEVLSLMPGSLIIPDLPFQNKSVRSNIHALFLAPSGSGKTSIAKLFSSFTYMPLEFESVTSARLESAIAQTPTFSLIVGDFARMSRDPVLIKVVEGILGEEKSVNRKTMKKDVEVQANGIGLLCGVSTDLSHYLTSGLIFRLVPIMVGHNEEEHSKIGEHIKDAIGNGEDDIREEIIKNYYLELMSLQSREETAIKGYDIAQQYRDKAYDAWKKMTEPIVKEIGFNFFREFQEFFRFLCASAFLNYYNRDKPKGILVPNDDDFKIALTLMKRAIVFKFRLLRSEGFAKGIKNAKDFQEVMKSDKIPEEYKEIIRNLAKFKDGSIKR